MPVRDVACDGLASRYQYPFGAASPEPERKVARFHRRAATRLLYVSSVTLAEIRFGIELLNDAGRRAELNDWLAHKVRPMFEGRVLTVSEDIMFRWPLWSRMAVKPAIPFLSLI